MWPSEANSSIKQENQIKPGYQTSIFCKLALTPCQRAMYIGKEYMGLVISTFKEFSSHRLQYGADFAF